jgi:hypothetical protein
LTYISNYLISLDEEELPAKKMKLELEEILELLSDLELLLKESGMIIVSDNQVETIDIIDMMEMIDY